MAVLDIGSLLFREILRMYEYPGSPFTGDMIRDLVTYFLVPTVFLIAVIYFSTGIIFGPAWRGFRLLFGLAAYLFVIVSGYYSIFAYIAGPYFFVLIIVVGIVYFFGRHFRRPSLRDGGGGGGPPGPGGPMPALAQQRNLLQIRKRLEIINRDLVDRQNELNMLTGKPGGDKAAAIVRQEISDMKRERYELERILNPLKNY
jgi:uncharacterized membrane protein